MTTKEKKIGFLETLENGKIVKSSTRLNALLMLGLTIWYVVYSIVIYNSTIVNLLEMIQANEKMESTLVVLTQTLQPIDIALLTILMLSWIAPKVIAKQAESKLK